MPKKKSGVPKPHLTPNQAEYIHQVQRIEKAVLKLSKSEPLYISTDILPERPKRITKQYLQKLSAIKPKTIERLNKEAKEVSTSSTPIIVKSKEDVRSQFSEKKNIKTPKQAPPIEPASPEPPEPTPDTQLQDFIDKVNASSEDTKSPEPKQPLPEPPNPPKLSEHPFKNPLSDNPSAWYDDENDAWYDENGTLLDPLTGKPYDEDLINDEGMLIYDNLMQEIAESDFQKASDYVSSVVDDVVSSIGLDGLARNLKEAGKRVIDFANKAFHPSMDKVGAHSSFKELVSAIRGGTLTPTDQFTASKFYPTNNFSLG